MRTSSHHRIRLFAAVTALTALAAVPATTLAAGPATAAFAPAQWAQDGYGAANTGYNPMENGITARTVRGLRPGWSVVSPHVAEGSCSRQTPPVVADGRLFLADSVGVAAYDVGSGRRLWRYPFGDPGDTLPPLLAVTAGRLIIGLTDCASQSDPDGHLVALDAATGVQRWAVSGDTPVGAMVVDREYLAISGEDAGHASTLVYRVADGRLVWTRDAMEMAAGVSAAGRLLLGRYGTHGVVSVDLATGAARWQRADDLSVIAADAGGTRFFAADLTGRLLALNSGSGRVLWSVPNAAGPASTDGDRIYVARGNDVRALATTTGAAAWTRHLIGPAGRPVLAGGVLYVAAVGRWLTSLNPGTGGYAGFRSTLNAVDHAVVVNGHLYLTDGSTLRTYVR
jgi:outer membrane protein assembly factor BamB